MAKEDTKGLGTGQEDDEDVEDQTVDTGVETNTDDDDDKGGKAGKSSTGGKKEKTFTQEQVTRMMTREKNQGRAAVFKELGIDPNDTKTVKMFQAFVESQKTDEQKAAEKDAAAAKATAEAEQRALIAEAKAEAMLAGVQKQFVEDAVTIAIAKVTDSTDLATVLGELKTKYPMWFEESEEDDKDDNKGKKGQVGQKGTGSSIKNNAGGNKRKPNGKEDSGMGARLAARRSASGKKSGYWGNSGK